MSFFNRSKCKLGKVKLVAIAKDEAAYLLEWIYHHNYFGVDSFDIHVNNTNDNTITLLEVLKKKFDINIINSDFLFKDSGARFQNKAYEYSLKNINKKEYSHIGFLDIDEFWTPKDFETSIKDFLLKNIDADVSVFNWLIHQDESDFSFCFKEFVKVTSNHHVKYFAKTNSNFKVGVHNALGGWLKYVNSNGESVAFQDEIKARLVENPERIPSAFILHRLYRSQFEYVSLLGRGRPSGSRFKNNRHGYYKKDNYDYKISFDKGKLNSYYDDLKVIIESLNLTTLINESKNYIINRYNILIETARSNTSIEEKNQLSKAFRNINIDEVIKIKSLLDLEIKRLSGSQRKMHIDAIRDAAVYFHKVDDIESAYALMKLAHELRPEGKFIEQKLKEFKQRRKRSIDA